MNMKKQSGFAHIFLIVVLVVVLLGALAFVFWKNHKKTGEKAPTSQSQTNQTTQKTETKPASTYTLTNAVADINTVIATSSCGGKGGGRVAESDFKVVNDADAFMYQGGKSFISKDMAYAYLQYGCGTSGNTALVKWVNGTWKLVSESARIYPLCSNVRGQGFPESVVDKCYVSDTATDPVAI